MKVIISDASKRMVYHRSGCIYASRITSAHQMTLNIRDALAYGYHECSCCGGLKGAVRVNRNSLNKAGKDIAFANKETLVVGGATHCLFEQR